MFSPLERKVHLVVDMVRTKRGRSSLAEFRQTPKLSIAAFTNNTLLGPSSPLLSAEFFLSQ
jgi:hypothetical protein